MKTKKLDAALVWKQLDDFVVPRLALNVNDRAVYSFLLRHSRLEGKPRLLFSLQWLARGVRLCEGAARPSLRRLIGCGALRLVNRTKAGHIIRVLLPREIRRAILQRRLQPFGHRSVPLDLEGINLLQNHLFRTAIYAREGGLCFYCLQRLTAGVQCIDHVVPEVRFGGNSYRNLVSRCLECNSRKGAKPAKDFLRWLYRDQRLTAAEFGARRRALDDLVAGKLRPTVATTPTTPAPRKACPSLTVTTRRAKL